MTLSNRWIGMTLALGLSVTLSVCTEEDEPVSPQFARQPDPQLAAQGREIFRFETFGDEAFWTDALKMHEVISSSVSPNAALKVGLKVDVDALPQAIRDGIPTGGVDLASPATTVTLLKLNAVVGLKGTVQTIAGRDTLTRVGITCALCHSTVDDSFLPGIGKRLDGWANRDLDPGAIIALSPALSMAQKDVYNSWGKGKYDPRFSIDGKNFPVVLPHALGLRRVRKEIYTGDDTISYWNAYVAVTQMGGQGTFIDPRLGINIVREPDLVTPKLPALREYQFSLEAETPPAGAIDADVMRRGRTVFNSRCAHCHIPGQSFTDINAGRLHEPAETGMEPTYAARSVTKKYRTTPLRGLWRPPIARGPYFHDGRAPTLEAVVDHYNRVLSLDLSPQQRMDLVAYLKTL